MSRKQYGDFRGNSGVTHYDIGPESITVHFGAKAYTYSFESAGKDAVQHMAKLAREGAGLASYIRRSRPRHAS